MAIRFKEIKKYIARDNRISLLFEEGYYHDYLMLSDIPDQKYDNLYVHGIGMADVEFSLDVYTKPRELDGAIKGTKDDGIKSAIEILLEENPREIERSTDEYLLFKDLKPYLQVGRNFSVVNREDWSDESYEYRHDIPEKYDDMYVYGVGMEDNPFINESLKNFMFDTLLKKRMVIVLSDKPRTDISQGESSLYGKGPYFLLVTADEWNHDADEWLGIYTNKNEAREAYDRAVAWYEEERKKSRYSDAQKIAMVEFISEEDRFREVDRTELD